MFNVGKGQILKSLITVITRLLSFRLIIMIYEIVMIMSVCLITVKYYETETKPITRSYNQGNVNCVSILINLILLTKYKG